MHPLLKKNPGSARDKNSARTLILINIRVISFNKCSTYFNKSTDKSILKTFCILRSVTDVLRIKIF